MFFYFAPNGSTIRGCGIRFFVTIPFSPSPKSRLRQCEVHPPAGGATRVGSAGGGGEGHGGWVPAPFTFDNVFLEHETTADVYDHLCRSAVEGAVASTLPPLPKFSPNLSPQIIVPPNTPPRSLPLPSSFP